NSHVLPALLRKFHEAKQGNQPSVEVWGTGAPLRAFWHVDDLAEACLYLMNNYNEAGHVNVGSASEITIKHLALLVKEVVGYEGELKWDTSKPDGTPRKLMDSSKLNAMGWTPAISLRDGIAETYKKAFL